MVHFFFLAMFFSSNLSMADIDVLRRDGIPLDVSPREISQRVFRECMASRCNGVESIALISCREDCDAAARDAAESAATAPIRDAAGAQRSLDTNEIASLQHVDAATVAGYAISTQYLACTRAAPPQGTSRTEALQACTMRQDDASQRMGHIQSRASVCVNSCRREHGDGSTCRDGCYQREANALRRLASSVRGETSSQATATSANSNVSGAQPSACTGAYDAQGVLPCCTYNWAGVLHSGEAFTSFSAARIVLQDRWNSLSPAARGGRELCENDGMVRYWRANRARAQCGDSSQARRSLAKAEILACVCGNGNASSQGGSTSHGNCDRVRARIIVTAASANESPEADAQPRPHHRNHHHSGGQGAKGNSAD